MSDESDNVIDIWPYQEDALLERAFANMRKQAQETKKQAREHLSEDGVVFADDNGKEVGYLIPVNDPEDDHER